MAILPGTWPQVINQTGPADSICDVISSLLKSIPALEGQAADNDTDDLCITIARLLRHLDALFSIAYKGERIVTEEDKAKFVSHSTKLDRLWKKYDLGYPVKLHVLVAHMPHYLRNGERTEEFMEQQHQIAAAFEARSRYNGQTKRRKHAADMEAVRNNEEIKAVQERLWSRTGTRKGLLLLLIEWAWDRVNGAREGWKIVNGGFDRLLRLEKRF